MIRYARGDATIPTGAGAMIIAHVVNDRGGWGKGFVVALSKRYPRAERAYRQWSSEPVTGDPPFALGEVQFVAVEPDRWVANMLAQHGFRSAENPVPLDYDALERCLATLASFAAEHGASVQMPRIGAGLAGGDWDQIAGLIERHLSGRAVTVYEL